MATIAEMMRRTYRFFEEQDKIRKKQEGIVRKLKKDLEFLSKNSGKYILMLNCPKMEIYSSGKAVWNQMNKRAGRPYENEIYFGKINKDSIKDYPILCQGHRFNIDRLSYTDCIRKSHNVCHF